MSTPKDLDFYQESINYLLDVQLEDGAISWEKDAKLDPWDHVESAMGLAIGGKIKESKRAFYWIEFQVSFLILWERTVMKFENLFKQNCPHY